MLVLLSPAKSLDESPADQRLRHSSVRLIDDAAELVNSLKKMSQKEIGSLMSVSEKLAELNAERYQAWQADMTVENAKQALRIFTGDVYQGIELDEWSDEDRERAQASIRILSGLYGVLRPEDLIMPYRLEMGTKLKNARGKDLYEFWGDRITGLLNEDITAHGHDWVCNLASNEYFKAVRPELLSRPVISPVFKDEKNGKFKIISFYAKKARGMMADFIVRNNLSNPDELQEFSMGGYQYSESESKYGVPVFLRPES